MYPTHGRVRTLITAGLVLCCAACSTPVATQADATQAAASAPVSTPTQQPAVQAAAPAAADKGEPTSTATATRPAAPPAPAKIVPVVRDGATPAAVLSAAPARADAAVTYADGVSARLATVSTSTVQGRGPGVLAGAPVTLVTVEVRNGSPRPLDLTRVVVSGRYGSPARLANVTYVPQSRDFSGPLAPGASATAVYALTFPSGLGRGDSLVVDLDAGHAPAVFLGPSA